VIFGISACSGNADGGSADETKSSSDESGPDLSAPDGSEPDGSEPDESASEVPGGTPAEPVNVKIGITGESENVIWKPVIEKLAEEGVNIEIVNFADYTLVNGALNDGDIDLNAFQHHAFLNQEVADKGYDIAPIGDTYISSMSIYSDKISDVTELKQGDKIAIPNDPVNLGRALSVAQGASLITLSGPANGNTYEITDISANELDIEFVQVDASQIPALLPDVAAGVINGNYALDFGLSPQNDAIFYDDVNFYPDNRYANAIVARASEVGDPVYAKIVQAYQSEEVELIYRDAFEGSYLPAWR
jgi:D-methionine transport system substrate-binding protein